MEGNMNFQNLFFYIHYCNYRKFDGSGRNSGKFTRTIPHHELIFITGGKGNITIDKKRYQVNGGMLFYIYPNVLYSLEVDAEGPGGFLSIHFSCARVSFNDNKWDINSQVEMLPLHPAQELKDYGPVYDGFKKLVDSWNAKLPGYEFITRTSFQQLFITIYQNTRQGNRNYGASLKMERIIQYMHQNINGQVTLRELSELVQLSPAYLSRAFKETTGYSVIEYFTKIRIDKAKELLIEGDKKVKEVAGVLGFSDEFYFSRIFKKNEGVSPSQYYSKIVHGV
jgi:AraC family transcriptional regulator, transcriptional activator for feuABC-ybbA operon